MIPKNREFKKQLRDELEKESLCFTLGRCCYQDSIQHYGLVEEEVCQGVSKEEKPIIKRRFAG